MTDRSDDHDVALFGAYLALAKRYRPDVGGEPEDAGHAYFRKIEEAYAILRDALHRMAYDTPQGDQRFMVSENIASHHDKADEQATPQRQHPWQAPAFESSPRVSATALGEGERKGKVEQLIIKVFLVVAALLFCSWMADILNRVPAAPLQPSDQNNSIPPPPQPEREVHWSNSAQRANDQSAPSNPAPPPAHMNGQPNSAPAPSDQNNPALRPSSHKFQPAFAPPSRHSRLTGRDAICGPVPLRYRNYWNCRDF
jgi:hypothetical protein